MNVIELFKQYIALLDEIYKLEAKTNILDGANELVRQGANANQSHREQQRFFRLLREGKI